MLKAIHVIYRAIEQLMRWTTIVLLVMMVVIVFSNVVSRYYLHASLAWSEEVARFMLVWLVFIGSFLAYIHDEHLGLDILVAKMPPGLRKLVGFCTNMLILFALYAILEGGYLLMRDNFDWLSPAAEPSVPVAAAAAGAEPSSALPVAEAPSPATEPSVPVAVAAPPEGALDH